MIDNVKILKRYIKSHFNLKATQEEEIDTFNEVKEGVDFKGKNLWVLVFAIFISCIGLNIDSKAAVIGAMIISPVMGPIFGIGFSLGITDPILLKLSFKNAIKIIVLSVVSATLYYLISPSTLVTNELLSFSKPTIFDIFLAFFGGMAGFIAITRHNGTQILIGVAVATSCIPPLCTAGFGLATLQWEYFIGGLYTYFINALFICLGTYLIAKYLKFEKHSEANVKHVNSWFGILILLAIVPAIYLAYIFTTSNNYNYRANNFINKVIELKGHVLNSKIDFENKEIIVDVMVKKYNQNLEQLLQLKLEKYNLTNSKLKIYQTIEAGKENRNEIDKLNAEIEMLKSEVKKLKVVK